MQIKQIETLLDDINEVLKGNGGKTNPPLIF